MCIHHICDWSHTCQHYPIKVQKCVYVCISHLCSFCIWMFRDRNEQSNQRGMDIRIESWHKSMFLLCCPSFPPGSFNPFSDDPLPAYPKKQLILKIISGQQLPKPPDSMLGDRGEVQMHQKHTLCASFLHLSSFSVSHTHTHKHTHALLYSTSQRFSACSQQKYIQHHKTNH